MIITRTLFNPPPTEVHGGYVGDRELISSMVAEYQRHGDKYTAAEIYVATEDDAPQPITMMVRKLLLAPSELKFAPEVVGMFAGLADRPGMITLYAYALARYTFYRGPYSLPDSFRETFPHGLPTERYAHEIWLEQKVPREPGKTDNYLDRHEAWKFSL